MIKILTAALCIFAFSLSYAEEQRYVVPLEGSPSCGPGNAAVTIIEFLDYQ